MRFPALPLDIPALLKFSWMEDVGRVYTSSRFAHKYPLAPLNGCETGSEVGLDRLTPGQMCLRAALSSSSYRRSFILLHLAFGLRNLDVFQSGTWEPR